ncbi:MAG: hypothetical protein AVDCRST_MAG54-4266, partial [uncultured Actinomycetospora sp.]
ARAARGRRARGEPPRGAGTLPGQRSPAAAVLPAHPRRRGVRDAGAAPPVPTEAPRRL